MTSDFLPKYKQTMNHIKQFMEDQQLKKGDMIPTEKRLQEELAVSRVTIRKAIDELVREGILSRRHGSGTYVNQNRASHNIFHLQGFTEEMSQQRRQTRNEILDFQLMTPDSEIQYQLNLNSEDRVYYVKRLRYMDEEPTVLEETYMPLHLFPDLSVKVMQGSKYQYIEREKGYKIKESSQKIYPCLPDKELQHIFKIDETTPILNIKLSSTLVNDVVFEYTSMFFITKNVDFSLKATRHNE